MYRCHESFSAHIYDSRLDCSAGSLTLTPRSLVLEIEQQQQPPFDSPI